MNFKQFLYSVLLILVFPLSLSAQEKPVLSIDLNMPALLRQGDHLELEALIMNNSDSEQTGQIQLLLTDAITNESVDGWFQNVFPNQFFTVAKRSSEKLKFPVEIPFQFTNVLRWELVASAGDIRNNKNGELPVLSASLYRSEVFPFRIGSEGVKHIYLNKLAATANNENILHKSLSAVIYKNRIWGFIRRLPEIAAVKNEPLDYLNKWSALAVSAFITDSIPLIGSTMTLTWMFPDTGWQASMSGKEFFDRFATTPWIIKETKANADKKYMSSFYHLAAMENADAALRELINMQQSNGSFPWMKGGKGDPVSTALVMERFNGFIKSGIISGKHQPVIDSVLKAAKNYLSKSKPNPSAPKFSGLNFSDLLATIRSESKKPEVRGDATITAGDLKTTPVPYEGASYYLKTIPGEKVNSTLANIDLSFKTSDKQSYPYFGNIEWNYFTASLPASTLKLQVKKTIMADKMVNKNKTFAALSRESVVHVGDRLKIVITVKTDKPVYYLFIEDENPSSFQQVSPGMFVNRSTFSYYDRKDVKSRKFFFPYLPAGLHQFSYWVTVTNTGSFTEGITTAKTFTGNQPMLYLNGLPVTVE